MVATLSPGARIACRALGFLLVAIGLAGLILALVAMTGGPSVMSPDFEGESKDTMGRFMLFGFGGMACLGLGAFLLRLGFLRLGAEILATETAPAVEHSAGAVGRGLRAGGLGQAVEVVKVKCRKCGFLESQDARFCSSCGKAV